MSVTKHYRTVGGNLISVRHQGPTVTLDRVGYEQDGQDTIFPIAERGWAILSAECFGELVDGGYFTLLP